MRQNRWPMRWMAWTVVVIELVGCTERNPSFCGDGTCSDPARPYCDYYGDFGAMPGTCIAVSCAPDSFALCRGDSAISCNSLGNNYESTACQLGCDAAASGCRQCTSNVQCTNGTVCDTARSECRGCQTDDECDSKVCDLSSSSCVPESNVIYASPNGPGGGTAVCTLAQPCAISKAVAVAANSLSMPVVRMLPGTYSTSLRVDVLNSQVKVVATGATIFVLGDVAAVVVDAGADLDLRGLSSTSERQFQCGLASTNAPLSSVTIRDGVFTSPGNATAFEIQRCSLVLAHADVSATNTTLMATHDDSTFDVDRLLVHAGPTPNGIIGAGSRAHLKITNSALENTNIVLFFSDTGAPGSGIKLAYDTIYNLDGIDMCGGTAPPSYITREIENSIIAASGTYDALKNATSGSCALTSTIVTHQATSLAGAIVTDPQFNDLTSFDVHLNSSSPAIDAATAATFSSDHDLENGTRPYGPAPDIGAYEYRVSVGP